MSEIITVACPICRYKVEWLPTQKFKPFCSERCKMIDLGDWATEAHKIACQPIDEDAFNEDIM